MSELTSKKQYDFLNAMKLVAAFFVVTIHCPFPGITGDIVTAVARYAVPFFFMVSGFFCYYDNPLTADKKIFHKIKHICKIMIFAFAVYLIFGIAKSGSVSGAVAYLKSQFTFKAIYRFLLFNNTQVSEFLWFLPALIYVYIIFGMLRKTAFLKKSYILIPLLIVLGVGLRETIIYFENMPQIMHESFIYRNFLFVGLPFFLMGYFIRLNSAKLKMKLHNFVLFLLMFFGAVESVAVKLIHADKSVYLGTAVLAFAVFVFTINNEDKIKVPHLASMGAEYSLYIYIFHILVRNIVDKSVSLNSVLAGVVGKLDFIKPIYIFLLTIIVSALYCSVKNGIIKLKRQIIKNSNKSPKG